MFRPNLAKDSAGCILVLQMHIKIFIYDKFWPMLTAEEASKGQIIQAICGNFSSDKGEYRNMIRLHRTVDVQEGKNP